MKVQTFFLFNAVFCWTSFPFCDIENFIFILGLSRNFAKNASNIIVGKLLFISSKKYFLSISKIVTSLIHLDHTNQNKIFFFITRLIIKSWINVLYLIVKVISTFSVIFPNDIDIVRIEKGFVPGMFARPMAKTLQLSNVTKIVLKQRILKKMDNKWHFWVTLSNKYSWKWSYALLCNWNQYESRLKIFFEIWHNYFFKHLVYPWGME